MGWDLGLEVNDVQEGHGKEEWADGSVFQGDFKAGWKLQVKLFW